MDSPLRPLPKLDDNSLLADLSMADDDSFMTSPTTSKRPQHPLGLPPPARPPRAPGHGHPSHPLAASHASSSHHSPSQSISEPSSSRPSHSTEPSQASNTETEDIHAKLKESASSTPVEGATSSRDEHLRTSLNELRRMNAVFEGFLSSLEASRDHAERLATKAAHSRALLAQYVTLMGQTHHTQELLLNTRWTGVKDDVAHHELAEQARIQAQEEAEARAHAEAERLAQEQREAEERAAAAAAAAERGATRGRGTGGSRGRGRGRVPSATGIPTRSARPGSASAGTASGVRKYDHVQSSGYGPRRS